MPPGNEHTEAETDELMDWIFGSESADPEQAAQVDSMRSMRSRTLHVGWSLVLIPKYALQTTARLGQMTLWLGLQQPER